jgi:hypothetical protein
MKMRLLLTLLLTLTLLATPEHSLSIEQGTVARAAVLRLSGASDPDKTYWVSPDGQAAWMSCKGAIPLDGVAACALSTANTNATTGDTVYLRGGTHSGQEIRPGNSGTSESNRSVWLCRCFRDGLEIGA